MIIGVLEVKDNNGIWQTIWDPEDIPCPKCDGLPVGCRFCDSKGQVPKFYYVKPNGRGSLLVNILGNRPGNAAVPQVDGGGYTWPGGVSEETVHWYKSASFIGKLGWAPTSNILSYDWQTEKKMRFVCAYSEYAHWKASDSEFPILRSYNDQVFRDAKIYTFGTQEADEYIANGRLRAKGGFALHNCWVVDNDFTFSPAQMWPDFVHGTLPKIAQIAPPERSRLLLMQM